MKRDIRKAVEEIKSAGMEDFLHQDPSTFECDDDCSSKKGCRDKFKCPKTRCTHVKRCTFVTKCTRVKKFTFVTTCTRVKHCTFITKVTRRKKCVFVTKCTRVKHCTCVTKCIRFKKKCFWTKRCVCKKSVFFPHKHSCHESCDHRKDCHDDGHKFLSCKNKKFDHFWYKKRNR